MKRLFPVWAVGIVAMMLLLSCASDNTPKMDTSNQVEEPKNSLVTTDSDDKVVIEPSLPVSPPPPLPPKPKEVTDKIEQIAKSSSFYQLGCCNTKTDRVKACCCDAVLAEFARMYEEEFDRLSKISSTDPILSGCRGLATYKKKIEKIENSDEDDEDW